MGVITRRRDTVAWRMTVEGTRAYQAIRVAADTGHLATTTARTFVKHPRTSLRAASGEMATSINRCLIPLALSHAAYIIGFGIILFGAVLTNLGAVDRESGAMFLIWAREIGTWITAMIFAGVVGSAITADLGARRIREELDALSVLGVDQIRALVVPRVVATTIAAPMLAFMSLAWITLVNFAVAPSRLDLDRSVMLHNLASTIFPLDLLATVLIKNTVLGLFVGLIACQKGLSCKPGAEGVGRAVGQTVVITFFGIWLFNSLFNLGYLTLFPSASALRG